MLQYDPLQYLATAEELPEADNRRAGASTSRAFGRAVAAAGS